MQISIVFVRVTYGFRRRVCVCATNRIGKIYIYIYSLQTGQKSSGTRVLITNTLKTIEAQQTITVEDGQVDQFVAARSIKSTKSKRLSGDTRGCHFGNFTKSNAIRSNVETVALTFIINGRTNPNTKINIRTRKGTDDSNVISCYIGQTIKSTYTKRKTFMLVTNGIDQRSYGSG